MGRPNKRDLVTSFKEVFIMKKLISMVGVVVLGCFVFSSFSLAQHSHGGMSMGTPMKMYTKDVIVEGVQVTFQIMDNDEHQKMLKEMKMKEAIEPGTTHNITVILKDEKTQKEIPSAQITMKVVDPMGKDQVKSLKYEDAMKSYDAYFKLPDKGKYQVIMLFKIGEQKRTAGIYYEIK
jgi:C4-type Zn-finger protein